MKIRTGAMRATFAALVVFYVVGAVIYSTAHAQQTGTEVRVSELERRAAAVDSEHLGERIAKVEAVLETNNRLLVAVLVMVAGMILERLVMVGKSRKEVTD